MLTPTPRRQLLIGLLVAALVAFGFFALRPVRETCTITSEPYGSVFDPDSVEGSGNGRCGEERTRFLTWFEG